MKVLVLRTAMSIAVMTLGLALTPTPAYGHNYMNHRVADPYCIKYGYWSLTENSRAATDWTITNNTNPTDLNVCAVRVNELQIVNVHDEYYSYVAAGQWYCNTYSGAFCTNATVQYNLNYLSTTTHFRSVACHESGHAYGLDELSDGTGGCMHEVNGVDTYYGFHNCCLMLNEMY